MLFCIDDGSGRDGFLWRSCCPGKALKAVLKVCIFVNGIKSSLNFETQLLYISISLSTVFNKNNE